MSKRNDKRNSPKRGKRVRGHWLADTTPRLAPGHYLPLHPGLTEVTCPDCGAHWEAPNRQRRPGPGGAIDHAPTCPIGKGYAEASDDDRAWFDSNPDESERVRPPTMAELQAVMLATGQELPDMPHGVRYEPAGEVVVRKLSDGLRARDFSGAILLAQPVLSPSIEAEANYDADEYDEHGVRWFREHLSPTDEGQWL